MNRGPTGILFVAAALSVAAAPQAVAAGKQPARAAAKYGTNPDKANAFGKCVSGKKAGEEDPGEGEPAEDNPGDGDSGEGEGKV